MHERSAARTQQENICKDTVKSLVLCANDKDYVSGTDSWQANSQCVTGAQATTFSQCKGASIRYEDSVATNLPTDMGYPAYVAAGTVTKGLQYQGLVGIPSHDSKVRQSVPKLA